jgi:hypothetical protein
VVSKAIASLDAWLARAEEVLAEQREHAISPSMVLWPGDGKEEWTITLAAFSEGLQHLLGSLCARPGRWILIVESVDQPNLFWQALAFEDGSLVTEVVSNHYLADEHHWTRLQEEQLLALGWEWHIKPYLTNWTNVQATTAPDIRFVAHLAVTTLRELFGLEDEGLVFVKMFSSALRGDTPAAPIYDAEEDKSLDPGDGTWDEECEMVTERGAAAIETCEGSAEPVAC